MPPCTELHIPHKKWAIEAGMLNGAKEEVNLLAIERWAREQSCGGGVSTLPQGWCSIDSGVIEESGEVFDCQTLNLSGAAGSYFLINIHVTAEPVDPETEYGWFAARPSILTSMGQPWNGGNTASLYLPSGVADPNVNPSVCASWSSIDYDIDTIRAYPGFICDIDTMPSGLNWKSFLTVLEISAAESCLQYVI